MLHNKEMYQYHTFRKADPDLTTIKYAYTKFYWQFSRIPE